MFMAFTLMISGHHFIPYASELAQRVERERQSAGAAMEPELAAVSLSD